MAKILIVEDDRQVADNVRDWLTDENHVVEAVHTGAEASFRLETYYYDLVVLDINLPDATGVEICRSYRSQGGTARVIMLTGLSEIDDKERGFSVGADDYLTKPFHPRELSARIRALMRRVEEPDTRAVLKVRDLELDSGTRSVRRGGAQINLLPREFDLLCFLMRSPNELFSQEAILARVWADDGDVNTGTVRFHIRKLREKLDVEGERPYIKTVHRQGYMLEA
ncbi:MAG: response regulator transcription factor [Candidatus Obscuribacterales bacterium]